MKNYNYFNVPIWVEQKPEFVKSLINSSNKYITNAKKRNKEHIKKHGDFGISHHSTTLLLDNNFIDFRDYVGEKSWQYLDQQGYDMSKYQIMFSELWVQEFAKKGGGHHNAHIHWNQHVCVFYFLKCSNSTSYPIFHDPKTGARTTKLDMKPNIKGIWPGHDLVHYLPQPGTLIIFPGYLEHEFSLDYGKEPFRFIHFNIQAVPKQMAKDV